ncbi:PAS domain S-box-containing protein/diguanylate cyclase (GGDEF) domain-containing protein [Noviherbaspirillum humi]|uniref:PAS domain S-box-containing protein/diguanylate cyclase (GGDEF) domain-containing protein n=1 Tax=Noviherbaspirillum humi TaxID=1688639 RepID=A0A239M1E6_9BURK|nr:EAL domain-containing protein [Noviherbaspirillum humi]SNT36112.1 PAS domain S-box-containing protein/diguanylate cyclase (GGDEF) domain-containing protein [Noviherbaspirillum humi]
MFATPKQSLARISLAGLLALAAMACLYWFSLCWGLDDMHGLARQRVDTVAASLFNPIEKYSYFPRTVASHPLSVSALRTPEDAALAARANSLLAYLNDSAGSEVLYLIDRNGRTVAASNWNRKDSFVGHDFSFRPYFRDAIEGREGRFYAMGTVSRVPGYYLSHPVIDGGRILGVVAVKVDLTTLDRDWAQSRSYDVTVTDEYGITFLSSRADWKYRPFSPLSEQQLQTLTQTKQYGGNLHSPFRMAEKRLWGSQALLWRVASGEGRAAVPHADYVVWHKKLEGSPWTVSVFMPAEAARKRALQHCAIAAVLLALCISAALYYREQRKRGIDALAAQASLRESHDRFRMVSKATSDVVWDWDLTRDQLWWNENMEAMFGHAPEEREAGGEAWSNRIHPDDRGRVTASIHAVIGGTDERWSEEYRFLCRDGHVADVLDRGFVIRDADGKAVRMVGSMTDISHRKESEKAIHRLAFYDALTGLPNRSLLQERLQQALAVSARDRMVGALLFIDLDNFKSLNDTLGHDKGDVLLAQVAERLAGCVRDCDTVSRLGGDEFVIMIERLARSSDAAAARATVVAEKVLEAFGQPFDLDGMQRHTSPSIGIALFDGIDRQPDEILKAADMAMYEAKADGRNTLRFFDPKMQELALARSVLEADLRHALKRGELDLHFQPQCDRQGQVHGAEALLRWQHAQRGAVPPAEFIPVAEQTGLIIPIGYWVLRQACLQLNRWAADPATASLTLAVNVSARQFHRSDFTDQVQAIIEETRVDPRRLKLELTESALVEEIDDAIAKMERLRRLGVAFSLDDFGTGYSSLAYLHRLPIYQLKIDRSFVAQVPEDANGAAIVHTIIALGRALGLAVIAEGVESPRQLAFLGNAGCDSYQGYLFGRPMAAAAFNARCGSAADALV